MVEKRYKLYLASGIKLWQTDFKDKFAPFFNHKLDLFQPALIDKQYTRNHKLIPIRIATKDLGEINKSNAVLAYMKMYDTSGNGPAGTDSTWECGYAIGKEKPTIMLVESMEHLDYYSVQWMVTYSIGAILTTNKEVAEKAKDQEKFTHTAILYCQKPDEFEDKIIAYLDNYYKSIYAREGIINFEVDKELRQYSRAENIAKILKECEGIQTNQLEQIKSPFEKIFNQTSNWQSTETYRSICQLEKQRAQIVRDLLKEDSDSVINFLKAYIKLSLVNFENTGSINDIAHMIEYWLSIPCEEVKGHHQGKKKTRPMIFYELYDLVSHHISPTQRYFNDRYAYQTGAVIEIYNWLNTYAIDDVFDNSASRQGAETLHIKFGSRKNALLLGGIGHCLSLLLLQQLTSSKPEVENEIINSLNDAQYLMYLGQPIDISLTMNNKKEAWRLYHNKNFEWFLTQYFERIYGICGAFYEEIGRMAVKSTNVGAQFYHQEESENACIQIAKYFGLVQMIRNDLGDLIFPEQMADTSKGMKDSSHNDIAEGKFTLPVIYTIFSAEIDNRNKKTLLNSMAKKDLSEREKIEISRIIWETGAIDFSLKFIDYCCRQVTDQYLKYIDETPTRLKWIIKLMDITPLINLSFARLAQKNNWRKLEPKEIDDEYINKLLSLADRQSFMNSLNG